MFQFPPPSFVPNPARTQGFRSRAKRRNAFQSLDSQVGVDQKVSFTWDGRQGNHKERLSPLNQKVTHGLFGARNSTPATIQTEPLRFPRETLSRHELPGSTYGTYTHLKNGEPGGGGGMSFHVLASLQRTPKSPNGCLVVTTSCDQKNLHLPSNARLFKTCLIQSNQWRRILQP